MKKLLTIIVFLASTGAAYAQETYDATGTITAQSGAKMHLISEGHMVIELPSAQNSFEMAAPNHPFEGLTGKCTGSAELNGASATGGGICVYNNAAGDMAFTRWEVSSLGADGSFKGTWVMLGGTGEMAGVTGGGNYNSLTNRETGAQSITLTGAITQP